ncbi:MAG: hypothetical protein FWG75_11085 [Cystobacterineae bacterium]|nr:hypothetical protein [Cystobacterineae bacterium]
MNKEWEKSFQSFLKQAGGEFRRLGKELKQEAQNLLNEMKEPQAQEKLKKSFHNFAEWVKASAKEVADMAHKHEKTKSEEGKKTKKGFCGFGKKPTSSEKTTWGEPVEKIHRPPSAEKQAAPPEPQTKKTPRPQKKNAAKTKPKNSTSKKKTTPGAAKKKTKPQKGRGRA